MRNRKGRSSTSMLLICSGVRGSRAQRMIYAAAERPGMSEQKQAGMVRCVHPQDRGVVD